MDSRTLDFDETRRRLSTLERSLASDAFLVVIYGPDLGRRHPIGEEVRIGRDRDNEIVVDSPDVSRHHAAVRAAGNGWVVCDLTSTNGTTVNGQRVVEELPIGSGDLLDVGGVIFKLISGGNVEALFYDEIYRLTVYDGLTALHNRRFVNEFVDREIARSRRHARPLTVAMIDIDHFKEVNDRYGHLAGDRLLTSVAAIMEKHVRREEMLGRWGGEEFALVMPETDLDGASVACEKLRRLIEEEPFVMSDGILHITISIGVAAYRIGIERDDLVAAADRELYRAKSAGRNTVCVES